MTDEDLEFSISQYADGTLPADGRAAVEAVLAADPAARAALAEHRRLTALLAVPPAGVDWDRLASRLSAGVADGDRGVAGRIGRAWLPWRIGAVAAAAAVAVTVGLLAHRGRPGAAVRPVRVDAPAVAIVTGPAVETGTGPAEAQVTIGPSPALAARGESWRYAEGVVTRPSTATIAAAEPGRGERFR